MKLLSFDIGIKNLAYSLVSIEKNHLQQVIDWGIVDLLASQRTDADTCCCAMTRVDKDKKPIVCGNKASQCIGKGDKKLLLCKNKKCECWVANEWKTINPKSKAKLASFKAKKATSYSLIDMASAMKVWIQQKKEGDWNGIPIDTVLLEHQPVFRNPVMKSVQMILVGILVGTDFHTNIQFVHASKKTKETDSYASRKNISVTMIQEIKDKTPSIFPDSVWAIWTASRKRDDLADTVNQATAWYDAHVN